MSLAVLWIDIFVFALLAAGLGAEFLAWLRSREGWRGYYLLSILSYALILFVQALVFFNMRYLPEPRPALLAAAAWIRSLSSVFLAVAYPGCVVRAAGLEGRLSGKVLLWAPAALTALGILASLLLASLPFAIGLNIAFNGIMALLSIIGTIEVAKGGGRAPRAEALPFLAMGSLAYLCFVAVAVLLVAGILPGDQGLASPVVTGAFCLAWSVLLIVSALRRAIPRPRASAAAAAPDGAPAAGSGFAAEHGLSQREAEVAALLVRGKTNREIGEELFISTRTVESHVYNAYRKCGCRNKAEFVAKVYSFKEGNQA